MTPAVDAAGSAAVTQAALAAMRGCSRQAISKQIDKLKAAGAVRGDGLILVDRALDVLGPARVQAQADLLPSAQASAPEDVSEAYTEAKAREAAARASLAEIELARKRRELIDRRDAEREVEAQARALRDRLYVAVTDAADRFDLPRATLAGLTAALDTAFGELVASLEEAAATE